MTAVIFDFNGTMVLDESFQEESWRAMLEPKIHRAITKEEFDTKIHGVNLDESLAYFFGHPLQKDDVDRLEEEKEVVYRKLCKESGIFCLVDGLEEFLDYLKENEIPFTIATASGLKNVQFYFEQLPLNQWFDFSKVVYKDGTFKGKPAPDIYLRAADKLGVNIADCVVFEDSIPGIQAACNAKVKKVFQVAKNDHVKNVDFLSDFKNASKMIEKRVL